MFSGSAADMLKKYGKDVPEQQPMTSLADAQAAKKKDESAHGHSHGHGEVCFEDHSSGGEHSSGHDHSKCTEDHGHGGGHEHGGEHDHSGCTEDHDHGSHDHSESEKKAGHDHGHGHKESSESSHDHGHIKDASEGHAPEEAHAATPAKPAAAFEGCAKGKYAWDGAGGKTVAADGAVGTAITDYAFGDGPKKASVYVDLKGLDAVPDGGVRATLVGPTRVEVAVDIGGATRVLTLSPLLHAVSAAKILRKPGKDRVVVKLAKETPEAWATLLAKPAAGFEEEKPASPFGGMGGPMGMDMETMMKSMAGMAGTSPPPDLGGADAPPPPPEEDDLDDLPDLEEDNVD